MTKKIEPIIPTNDIFDPYCKSAVKIEVDKYFFVVKDTFHFFLFDDSDCYALKTDFLFFK